MKTILAATDFSSTSKNAVNYAAEMALSYKAKLLLVHVFSVPISVEAALPAFSLDDVEKDCKRKLNRMQTALHAKYGKHLSVTTICKCGFAADELKLVASEHQADVMIMGMQGAGYLAEKINGSITTLLMADAACPVMSIDKKMTFVKPKKIVLATDLKEIKHKGFAKMLNETCTYFKSELLVLNVFKPGASKPTISEAVEGMKLDALLKGIKHKFVYVENKDVTEGINSFVKEQKANLVIMIGRKHSLFQKIFNEPQTKRMAFHANTPLLVFHD